jgi:hypothetical protein
MKWDNKDWKWLTGVLIGLIVTFLSLWIWNIKIDGYFSVLSSAVSIALALVAIYIAVKQDTEGTRTNQKTQELLTRIDEKVNGVRDNLLRIEQTSVYTKTSADVVADDSTDVVNVSRIHGLISSSSDWSGKDFVNKLNRSLAEISKEAMIIDYSIIGIENSDSLFKYSKLISLIINKEITERLLESTLESTLEDIHVGSHRMKMYYNSKVQVK